MKELILRMPDDMHVHLRTGQMLADVLPFSNIFGRCVVMGNLPQPIVNAQDVKRYREEIFCHRPNFIPLMSVMLVNQTTPQIVLEAHQEGARVLKLIPGGASTNSDEGVSLDKLEQFYPVLEKAQELGMIFSGHWELGKDFQSGQDIPEVEREVAALPYLKRLTNSFPKFKIVVEHVSTRAMADFVKSCCDNVAATITAHHAVLTFKDVLNEKGEIKNPLNYCKPIAKSEDDRRAVIEAMISGNKKFFFGSDSAPHNISQKIKENPAAGIFSSPIAVPLLAEIFEGQGRLERLEDFVSRFGAEFYGLPTSDEKIILRRGKHKVPILYRGIPIFKGGGELEWHIAGGIF